MFILTSLDVARLCAKRGRLRLPALQKSIPENQMGN
jgi:hypothetical protein